MSADAFAALEELQQQSPKAVLDRLVETLTTQKNYHRLFDALLMQKKLALGTSLLQPTSFDNVAEGQKKEFEEAYIDAARQVGNLFLADKKYSDAWLYFQTIQEPEPVAEALKKINPRTVHEDKVEELIQVCVYEGANPEKGFEIMLQVNGICNTITVFDQMNAQLKPEERQQVACLLVDQLYADLVQSLQYQVQQKVPMAPPTDNLRELMAGRDWMFESGSYHIDVSHLNSVVRFARLLPDDDPHLSKVIELCEYGSRLDSQFQYPGETPFEDFYPAHMHFFKALVGDENDQKMGVAYFESKLDQEPDEDDKQMIAYALIDLLTRVGQDDRAIELAEKYLSQFEDPNTFSFTDLCLKTDHLDVLLRVARGKGDLVTFAGALLDAQAQSQTQES
ncbi:hypothetical protein [Gimesia algae]|uniref:Tetratricopeptide repeat protein n=1 Tax=Gimesia algae TaxID=2527971 RepID=A0A517VEA5_9PLAN|nr:hypothetical protein [Gimesia algae]QDT91342.1 hypothetical protein Pan161_29990 [Gimesia algae]